MSKRYIFGKPYNVQSDTVHNHIDTWKKFVGCITNRGYITDIYANSLSEKDGNPKYFEYVVKRGWLKEMK